MPETTKYLLIGGYAAGCAAQAIRERDTQGRVVLACGEAHPPHDRPPLSKQALVDDSFGPEDALSKPHDFYAANSIELRTGTRASRIDREARTVHFEDGSALSYEKLLLAPGAKVKPLDTPGSDKSGLFYLRTIEDSLAIRAALQEAQAAGSAAVVLGSSYLGMESASGCTRRGLQTTVIEKEEGGPWGKFASPGLQKFVRGEYEKRGVRFLFGAEVESFEGDGSVSSIQIKGSEPVPTGVVIASVGVSLDTKLAQEAGLEVDEKDGIIVSKYLQTEDESIWAAGDAACFEDVALGKRWHAEHYLNARWQGQRAGANMAAAEGEQEAFDRVAYFYSDFLDLHLIQRGDPQAGDKESTTVLGDMASGEFVELYADESGRLRMGVGMSHDEPKLDAVSDTFEQLIRAKANVSDIGREHFPSLLDR